MLQSLWKVQKSNWNFGSDFKRTFSGYLISPSSALTTPVLAYSYIYPFVAIRCYGYIVEITRKTQSNIFLLQESHNLANFMFFNCL